MAPAERNSACNRSNSTAVNSTRSPPRVTVREIFADHLAQLAVIIDHQQPVHAAFTLTSRWQSGKGSPAGIDKSLRPLHQLLPHNLAVSRLIDSEPIAAHS